jgi:hypothetical protein
LRLKQAAQGKRLITMKFGDPAIRAAYRRGARDAYESVFSRLDATVERELTDWLSNLDHWQEGDPPDPPYRWYQK